MTQQKTTDRNIPKLRFSEFRDAGAWGESKLGIASDFVKEKMPLNQLTLDNYVSTVNLLPEYSGVIRAPKMPPSGSVTKFKKEDILISNIRPYLKKIWLATKDGGASNDVIVVRSEKNVSNKYLSFILMTDPFISHVMIGAKGVKMPRGDISQMKEYPLAIPTPKEQQKIADFLFSLDELIAAQTQKLDTLNAHKKGLMQQLFPSVDEVHG